MKKLFSHPFLTLFFTFKNVRTPSFEKSSHESYQRGKDVERFVAHLYPAQSNSLEKHFLMKVS